MTAEEQPAPHTPSDVDDDTVAAVLRHVEQDRPGLALEVVRAHGHPHAAAARLVGLDARGSTWRVTGEDGDERAATIAWRSAPALDEQGLRGAVEALHTTATSSLRWSLAMGEHGMLRYSGPVADLG